MFAWHKLPLRSYLVAVAGFCNQAKGKSMLAFSRELDVQYKTAFVLAHKLRDSMASSVKGLQIGGEGRLAEIDGVYFGGYVRPENRTADRVDRRRAENRSGERRVVLVMRERRGRTLAQVFGGEGRRAGHPPADRPRHRGARRRELGLEPTARPVCHATHRPAGRPVPNRGVD